MYVCPLWMLCCQMEVSESNWPLVQTSLPSAVYLSVNVKPR
jgi:hypothetical protein